MIAYSKFHKFGGYIQKEWEDGTLTCSCMFGTMEWSRNKDRNKIRPCKHIKEVKMELTEEQKKIKEKFEKQNMRVRESNNQTAEQIVGDFNGS